MYNASERLVNEVVLEYFGKIFHLSNAVINKLGNDHTQLNDSDTSALSLPLRFQSGNNFCGSPYKQQKTGESDQIGRT
jgi:hypothetical protein